MGGGIHSENCRGRIVFHHFTLKPMPERMDFEEYHKIRDGKKQLKSYIFMKSVIPLVVHESGFRRN